MKLEFVDSKDKVVPSFKAGDIIGLKADDNLDKTIKTNYYLIGLLDKDHGADDYYLTNIKTGVMVKMTFGSKHIGTERYFAERYFDRANLAGIITHNNGKVYSGTKVKLIIEEIK